jgi:transposase InsO family protein
MHGELLKLGFSVSEATVSKYMIRHSRPPSQSWRKFLQNHAKESISLDFFVVPTAAFRVLFVLLILSNDRRNIIHFNVTSNPTAHWTARQLLESCGFEETPKYVIRDRDAIYGKVFNRQANVLTIKEIVTVPRSPWQNAYVERIIRSVGRECVDHVIVLGERHLKRVLSDYVDYYNNTRTHLSLTKDAPKSRERQKIDDGNIVSIRRVGGLHHEYRRVAA